MTATNPFSMRLKYETRKAAQEKAKQKGITMVRYIRELVEDDLKPKPSSAIIGESKEEIVLKVSSAPKKIVILVEEDKV